MAFGFDRIPQHLSRRGGRRPVLFHAGTQQGHSPEVLRAMAAFGVNHICGREPSASDG
jgi:hypothetical protein